MVANGMTTTEYIKVICDVGTSITFPHNPDQVIAFISPGEYLPTSIMIIILYYKHIDIPVLPGIPVII